MKRSAKERAAGFNRRDVFPEAVAPGGVLTPSGIKTAHEAQAAINRSLDARRMSIGHKPQSTLEELRSTWSNQFRGGGIGWARQAKKLHMAEKMPLPRNKVARGIGLALSMETGAEIARSGDQVVDAVAENARRKLWENNTRDPYGAMIRKRMSKEELMRATIAQLDYMGYKLAPSKK